MQSVRAAGRAVLVLIVTIAAGAAAGAPGGAGAWQDGLYTVEQAERGRALYDAQCTACHGPIRAIVPEMAALLGDHTFRNKWRGRSLGELFGLIQETMPQDAPGTLTLPQTADLVAHILQGNRAPAGAADLPGEADALARMPFDP